MLTDQEQLRYSRHLLLDKIGTDGQLALKNASVLIVGVGGLGNPASMYLAASGVGRLFLADGDKIELSNLQRQVLFDQESVGENKAEIAAEKLANLNEDIDIEPIDEFLDEESLNYYVSQVDLVLDCTDNIKIRHSINRVCHAQKKPLIIGAAIRLEGQLLIVNNNDDTSPCYQCLYPEGQDVALNCQTAGVLSPVLGIIGSSQALEAIKLLTGKKINYGKLHIFDGLSNQWRYFNLSKSEHCQLCSDMKPHKVKKP